MHRLMPWVFVCLSAVVGAGFASGKELMSFFARYGPVSWAGILGAAWMMGLMARMILSLGRRTGQVSFSGLSKACLGPLGPVGSGAFSLLLLISAGAMTAAGGEIFSLLWPFQGGYPLGIALTLGLGLFGAPKGLHSLEKAGRCLLPGLILLFLLGMALPPWEGKISFSGTALDCLASALAYGGLNMTLAAPALLEAASCTNDNCRRMLPAVFSVLLLLLMALGNSVLLRHRHLTQQALPLVQLLRAYGKGGFLLCALCLYLAVLTTLLASVRGLYLSFRSRTKAFTLPMIGAAALLTALGGFGPLVEKIYPLLGWGCLLLLLLMAAASLRLNPTVKCDRIHRTPM